MKKKIIALGAVLVLVIGLFVFKNFFVKNKDENLEKSIDKIQDLLYENIKNQEKFEGLNEIKLENFKIGL